MTTKAILLVAALVAAVAAAFVAPSLDAAGGRETQIAAAAAGVFPAGTTFNGLAVEGSRFSLGVVVRADGSAVGQFQTVLTGTSLSGQPQSISLEGEVMRGTLTAGERVTLSGTATLSVGSGLPTTVPFSAATTTSGLLLTVGAIALPVQTLRAGSIFIG